MKKTSLYSKELILKIICCILILVIIGMILFYKGEFAINRKTSYTMDEINEQLYKISEEKTHAFSAIADFYKSEGIPINSAEIDIAIKKQHPEYDMKIEYLKTLKEKLSQEEIIKSLNK